MNIAVIFAGGVGARMHSTDKPKQFLEIHGKPIIIHTLEHFEMHPAIDIIIISCLEEWIPYCKEIVEKYRITKVAQIVSGGKTGQESIYNGLCAADKISDSKKSVVLIHDGVRPLIDENLISENINSVLQYGSAISSVPMNETVLMVGESNYISYIPDRNSSRMARAPQSFWLNEILDAHKKAIRNNKYDFVDSCSLMQYYGKKLHLIDSPRDNIKITTPEDFYIMRALLDKREDSQIFNTER